METKKTRKLKMLMSKSKLKDIILVSLLGLLGVTIFLFGGDLKKTGLNLASIFLSEGTDLALFADAASSASDVIVFKDDARHLAFPGITRLANGNLAVVYRNATQHSVDTNANISMIISSDGGFTWGTPTTVMDRDGDDRDPSIFQMSNGTIIITSSGYLISSSDGGSTWTDPIQTPGSSPSGLAEDENGNLLYGLYRLIAHDYPEAGTNYYANQLYKSTTNGSTWTALGVATYTIWKTNTTTEDYLWEREPSICVIPNRYVLMATTNRMVNDSFTRIYRSTDYGVTWSSAIVTPIRGKPSRLLWLGGDMVLMTYSYRYDPYGVRATISYDAGLTWDIDHEIILRSDGGTISGPEKVWDSDLGYPVTIKLNETSLFTVYYFNKNGSNAYIAGTIWDYKTNSSDTTPPSPPSGVTIN